MKGTPRIERISKAQYRGGATRSSVKVVVMKMERKGGVNLPESPNNLSEEGLVMKAKSFEVSRPEVWEAWKTLPAKKGSSGIDNQTIEYFEKNI